MSRAGIGDLDPVRAWGCGGAPGRATRPPLAPPWRPRWRRGRAAARASRSWTSPLAMHVADYRWEAGFKLSNYKIDGVVGDLGVRPPLPRRTLAEDSQGQSLAGESGVQRRHESLTHRRPRPGVMRNELIL